MKNTYFFNKITYKKLPPTQLRKTIIFSFGQKIEWSTCNINLPLHYPVLEFGANLISKRQTYTWDPNFPLTRVGYVLCCRWTKHKVEKKTKKHNRQHCTKLPPWTLLCLVSITWDTSGSEGHCMTSCWGPPFTWITSKHPPFEQKWKPQQEPFALPLWAFVLFYPYYFID